MKPTALLCLLLTLFAFPLSAQIDYVIYDGSDNVAGTVDEPFRLVSTAPGITSTSPDATLYAACHNFSACKPDQFALSYASGAAYSFAPPPPASTTHTGLGFVMNNGTGVAIPVDEIEFDMERFNNAGTPTQVQICYRVNSGTWVNTLRSVVASTSACTYGTGSVLWTFPASVMVPVGGTFEVKLQMFGGSVWCDHYEMMIDRGVVRTTIPFPARWTEFSANMRDDQEVELNWITSYETGSREFLVERSVNGTDFETIDAVAAAGDSENEISYLSYDRNLPASERWYYRITALGVDGDTKSSWVIEMQRDEPNAIPFRMYPNPASDRLTIELNDQSGRSVAVYNTMGQKVLEQEIVQATEFDLQSLDAGHYIVRLQTQEAVYTQPLIVR